MKGIRFSEEQIIGVLREHEAGGKSEEVCRRHGYSSTPAPFCYRYAPKLSRASPESSSG
jgi:putative transposase